MTIELALYNFADTDAPRSSGPLTIILSRDGRTLRLAPARLLSSALATKWTLNARTFFSSPTSSTEQIDGVLHAFRVKKAKQTFDVPIKSR